MCDYYGLAVCEVVTDGKWNKGLLQFPKFGQISPGDIVVAYTRATVIDADTFSNHSDGLRLLLAAFDYKSIDDVPKIRTWYRMSRVEYEGERCVE